MTGAERKSTEHLKAELAAARFDDERLDVLVQLRERGADLTAEEFDGFLKRGVELARTCGRHEDRAKLATSLANTCLNSGDSDGILHWAEVVREVATALGSRRYDGSYSYLAGLSWQHRGEFGQAHACFETAQRLWTGIKYVPGISAALNALASLHGLQGRYAEALECYQECLKLDEEQRDDAFRAVHQFNAGFCLQQLGRWEDAAESFYRTIELCDLTPSAVRGSALNALGELFMHRNWLARASGVFEQVAREQRTDLAPAEVVSEAWLNLGRVRRRMGDLVGAGSAFATALERGDGFGDRRLRALALGGESELALAQGDAGSALDLALSSVSIVAELGLKADEAQSLRVEGLARGAMGERDAAAYCFDRALFLLEDSDDSVEAARVRLDYGRFLLGTGEFVKARTHLAAASRAFRKHAVAADAEEAVLLLFDAEYEPDLAGALLRAVSGLKALRVEPRRLVERVLTLLCRAFRLAGASVLVDGRPAVAVGTIDAGDDDRPAALPFECGGSACSLRLERSSGSRFDPHNVVLDAVVNLLAPSVATLVGHGLDSAGVAGGNARLRYRGARSRNLAMLEILTAAPDIANTGSPVLLRGEPGTGRELIALAIHESGPRAVRPFARLDCAIPMRPTREREFFGEERPAVRGGARIGRLEAARGGTAYLANVEEAGPELQERLVALLRDGSLARVGGTESVSVELRVVAGTGSTLEERVGKGQFRRDLHELLRGTELRVPPLRERPEDIDELVSHFVRRCGEEFGRLATGVDPEAMARLLAYPWPGNVPELEAAVEQGVLLARGNAIQVNDLPARVRAQTTA
jgi:tetratricopeptide (TPR) repeat protein